MSARLSDGLASATVAIEVNVNGRIHRVDAEGDTPLLYVLRDELGLTGPKFGCGLSQCGACAVLADGRQIRSCVTPLNSVKRRKIVTVEGLRRGDKLHPLQQAWIDEQVPQCGYCQSGMIIQAADLLARMPRPSEEQIRRAMNGHLCRCGTYGAIVRAIERASGQMVRDS